VHYVDNALLFRSLVEYRAAVAEAVFHGLERPQVTTYIGECIMKIATHLAYKPNFSNYIYREDMICDGIENCLQYIDNFDPAKSKNPFAYFTQIIYFAFVRRIKKEKRHMYICYKAIDHANIQQETSGRQSHDQVNRHHDVYSGEWSHEQMYAFIEDFEKNKRRKRVARKIKMGLAPTNDGVN
jgi:DNA-directed RNA polymerase specialized sigma24 family protein